MPNWKGIAPQVDPQISTTTAYRKSAYILIFRMGLVPRNALKAGLEAKDVVRAF